MISRRVVGLIAGGAATLLVGTLGWLAIRAGDGTRGNFHLQGTILDQAGKPLDAVTIRVVESRVQAMGTKPAETREWTTAASRQFDLTIRNCSAVTLSFRREGYYPESMDFAVEFGRPVIGASAVVQESLQAVLIRKEHPTSLADYSAVLEFSPTASVVVDLDLPPRNKGGKDPVRRIDGVPGAAALPRSTLYLSAPLTPDGRIALSNIARQQSGAELPVSIVLGTSDPQGGFIRHQPVVPQRQWREMLQAPAGPYEPTLVVTENDIQRAHNRPHEFCFFFKCDGRYGRGSIARILTSRDDRSAKAGVWLRVQPDGSRNLEAME